MPEITVFFILVLIVGREKIIVLLVRTCVCTSILFFIFTMLSKEQKRAARARARRNAQKWASKSLSPPSNKHSPSTGTKMKKAKHPHIPHTTTKSESIRETLRDLYVQKQKLEETINLLTKRLEEVIEEETFKSKKLNK